MPTLARCLLATLAAILLGVAPAHAATTVARGHSPDAVTDRDGTTHLVWSEYRPRHPGDTSARAKRIDITHYCKIPRGATTCTGEETFTACAPAAGEEDFADDGIDYFGPHVMISPFGDVLVYSAQLCRVVHPDDPPRSYFTRYETYVWSSEDDGDTALGVHSRADASQVAWALVGDGTPQ
jgi:hypothetical protein